MATEDKYKAAREAGERIQERIERTGDDAKAAGARIRDFIEDKAEEAGDAAKATWEKVRGDDPEKA